MPPVRKPMGTMTVRGKAYPVLLETRTTGYHASGAEALFVIEEVPGSSFALTAPSWVALYDKMMLATKQANVKIAIPFVSLQYRGGARNNAMAYLKHGTIVGRHGNQNYQVLWDGATRASQERDNDGWLQDMPTERQEAYLEVVRQWDKANTAREKFEEMYKFDDLDGQVDAEIERVASEDERP